MLIIAILGLAVILFLLLSRPRRQGPRGPDIGRTDSVIYDLPDEQWHERPQSTVVVPGFDDSIQNDSAADDFTAGGGDFGGAGSSGDWSDSGDGGSD